MNFEKLPAIKGGCLNCGYQYDILPLDAIITVGFGYAALTKNGEEIYNETDLPNNANENAFMACEQAEELARKDPDNDWRIHLVAPLWERHYQRQGENQWVLYEKGIGFA